MKNKITLIHGEGKPDPRADLLRKFADAAEWSMELQLLAAGAKIRKASYDAHIAAGFTPEQALVLVK